MGFFGLVLGSLLVALIPILWKALLHLIWRPYSITKLFREQGVCGPAYQFWTGSLQEIRRLRKAGSELILDNNCHDYTVRVFPHYRNWTHQYGTTFLLWIGSNPRLCVGDIEMVKQVLSNKFGFYLKTEASAGVLALVGKGLVLVEGEDWVRHRRILNPAFAMDKLKLLTKTMDECAKATIEAWRDESSREDDQQQMEIDVSVQFQELTADVISRTAFGSSYKEGKEVFLAQKKLQVLVAESFFHWNFYGSKYFPTKQNLQIRKLEKIIRSTLMGIIKNRMSSTEDSGFGNDLLGLMLEARQVEAGRMLSLDEIVDECKTFFFAGQETTSYFLTWAMFLLSTNKDWQEKLRDEVLQHCRKETPNADMLSRLKPMNMVLLETLRLYGPVILMGRKAERAMTLGSINIPKDTSLIIPIALIQRNKKLWGADADEFNPLRFANGMSQAATHPNALLSFSIGPRACIGQNFAMLEAKVVLAKILQQFSFSLSPKYKHAPMDVLTLRPKYGLPVVLRPLHV
ncbi:cytochrome P450 709B2-like [Zingiber officinale]|uniref:cytochrome P450 709B2-like n=1 Tax=Zingiber officinale TaxID=94328 RepID=UPI001C4BCEA7|nr:cytochrome P450 709B2-like [Zingiber officinale]